MIPATAFRYSPVMLQELYVKNLAVVEEVCVSFQPGLNVVTGETGTGKSVIMGAISLLMGERADRSLIRSGCDGCIVRGTFVLADTSDVDSILEECGFSVCEDGLLIIRREITTTLGRNYVNDCPTTTQTLRRLGDILVDTHGPHEHQSLLQQGRQLDLLDAFGHTWRARDEYEKLYAAYTKIRENLARIEKMDQAAIASEMDTLAYQIEEIETAGLHETDEQALVDEHRAVANAAVILECAYATVRQLSDDKGSVFESLVEAQREFGRLEKLLPQAAEWRRETEELAMRVQDMALAVDQCAASIDADPDRLQWLDEHIAVMQKLKRKYGGSMDKVQEHLERCRRRMGELSALSERAAEIREQLREMEADLMTLGGALSLERAEAATALAKAVSVHLRDLGLKHAVFRVDMMERAPAPSGLDEVDFAFAPNVGESIRPLRSIASSGEISRVMLASKVVLADHDQIPLMVFDEIDSNIGGETGTAVGEKLRAVARNHQVVCITHLPQVAVYGGLHLVVSKTVEKGRTITGIHAVDGTARVEEVARMLGGKDSTTVVLDHAREMLARVEAGDNR